MLFCTGGLQMPKQIALPDESAVSGDVINGISSEVDNLPLEGRRVCVLGIPSALSRSRTRGRRCSRGAEYVTIVARKRGTCGTISSRGWFRTMQSGLKERLPWRLVRLLQVWRGCYR